MTQVPWLRSARTKNLNDPKKGALKAPFLVRGSVIGEILEARISGNHHRQNDHGDRLHKRESMRTMVEYGRWWTLTKLK